MRFESELSTASASRMKPRVTVAAMNGQAGQRRQLLDHRPMHRRYRGEPRLQLPLVVDRVGGGDHAHNIQLFRAESRQVALADQRRRPDVPVALLAVLAHVVQQHPELEQLRRLRAEAMQRPELIE